MKKTEKLKTFKYIILLISSIFISVLQGCSSAQYSIFPGLLKSGEKDATFPGNSESVEKDVTLIIATNNQPDTIVGIEQIDHEQLNNTGFEGKAEYKLAPGRHTVFYYFVRQEHASVITSADLNTSFSVKAGHVYELKNFVRWDDESPEKIGVIDLLTVVIDKSEDEVVTWESRGERGFKEEVQTKTGIKLTELTENNAGKTDSIHTPTSLCRNEYSDQNESNSGCPYDSFPLEFVSKGDEYKLHKAVFFDFVYKGNKYGIHFIVNRVVYEKLMAASRLQTYGKGKALDTKKDFILQRIDNQLQRENLLPLVEKIKSLTPDVHTQARIAISLVQNIPYTDIASYEKYPYVVLWEHGGACSEKSDLLLFFLRELGFETATLVYKNENHRAVGIKCPDDYDVGESGYCYVETTTPKIITDNNSGITEVMNLTNFTTVHISEGIELEGVEDEFSDKNLYYSLINRAKANNWLLDEDEYNLYNSILNKYGIE